MTVELKPELEEMIRQQLASGNFKSIDEVLISALSQLPHRQRSNRTAVARMLEFSQKNSVKLPPGERVEDLVRDAHRY
jgi:Arc/MetJ-type ribon-helix-helix transcriptional regulator